ncbi:MAG: T9SS type A sorting domain-containing protein [Flavobacteriales bacterium]|nr:T9SS type A sorting domain-containing protein [Flavobacteriales bacterium]
MKSKLVGFIVALFVFAFHLSEAQTCSHRGHAHSLRSNMESLRSDTIDVLDYDIFLDVTDFSGATIGGSTTVKFHPLMNNIQQLSLDLLHMNIDSVKMGTQVLAYTYTDTLLQVILPGTYSTADTLQVSVFYHGTPQMDPSGWGGWYWNSGYAFNLGVGFEAIPHNYGRVWHACFDNFIERATYTITVKTNNGKRAYCNGYLVNETVNGSDIIRQWRMDTPILSYLACVNVAAYTHVQQSYVSPITSNTTPIWLTALPVDTTNMKNSFVHLPDALEAFETGYGPYIWNKVGYSLVPFSSGAMEHATNIAYPLLTANGSTFYETLMAHELSHHWWGDLVTCISAEHMWINEGMARYSECLFLEHLYGSARYNKEIRDNHKNVLWKAHIDDGGYFALSAIPLNVTYGTTTYDKGADVVHTMRSYIGDTLFFAGLHQIIANNQFQNLSSEDFRDQMNLIPGVDLNDFFDGWILNPGFPHFSIDSIHYVQNGPNWDAQLFIGQKLRGAPAYYNNVPINVFFRDASWNVFVVRVMAGGAQSVVTVQVPFQPVYASLNEDEKISDAVTGENLVIKTNGLKGVDHANFQFNVYGVNDSAFVRVEHHWVGPDDFMQADFYHVLSPDRYWRLTGIDWQNIYATAKLNYNGTTTGAGYLDDGLMVDHGSVLFHEDSLILFYRSKPGEQWTEYPHYTRQTQASKFDKVGTIVIDSVKMGEYTFGMRVGTVGISEIVKDNLEIYPNPVSETVIINVESIAGNKGSIQIMDASGKMVLEQVCDQKKISCSVQGWPSGTYVVVLLDKSGKKIKTGKLVVR